MCSDSNVYIYVANVTFEVMYTFEKKVRCFKQVSPTVSGVSGICKVRYFISEQSVESWESGYFINFEQYIG